MLKEKIIELIKYTETYKDSFYLIFISGENENNVKDIVKLTDKEKKEINGMFCYISNYYHYYTNTPLFVGDVLLDKLNLFGKKILVYNASQFEEKIDRRLFIPQVSEKYDVRSLTCNSFNVDFFEKKDYYLKEIQSLGYAKNILEKNQYEGKEIEVSVLKIKTDYYALDPIEVIGDKINKSGVDKEDYCYKNLEVENNIINKIKQAAENIAHFLEADGLIRIDFKILPNNEFYIIDIYNHSLISNYSSTLYNFKQIFPEDPKALYKTIIGMQLIK